MILKSNLILIPARYASTRFPGKPLVEIAGKPMIQHVYEKATAVSEHVYVATDDERIYDTVIRFGGRAVMTATTHKSGTDRCYEAYQKVKELLQQDFEVIVNVQGDEPFILPEQIEALISRFEEPDIQIATLAKPFEKNEEIFDPNKVKIVFSQQHMALYFSRCPIPFCRGVDQGEWLTRTRIPQGILEKAESLEQLRWLENGYKIAVSITHHESIGIDTPEDLKKILQD